MADPYEIRYAHEAVEDIRPLRAFDRRRIVESIARAREQARNGQTISHDKLKSDLGLK